MAKQRLFRYKVKVVMAVMGFVLLQYVTYAILSQIDNDTYGSIAVLIAFVATFLFGFLPVFLTIHLFATRGMGWEFPIRLKSWKMLRRVGVGFIAVLGSIVLGRLVPPLRDFKWYPLIMVCIAIAITPELLNRKRGGSL